MGKVIKAVAVIAVAVAIAYFAPQLAPAFLNAALGTAAAASITATVLTAVAGMAMQALAGKPTTGTAPGRQSSRGMPREWEGFGWRYPPDPEQRRMAPVAAAWWRETIFWPWQRFAITRIAGDCMVPVIPKTARWIVVDRTAPINAGDQMVFRPDDLRAYMRSSGEPLLRRWWSNGLVKRFVGVDAESRVAVYETTNPPNRMESGLDRLLWAHRVVSWHPTYWQAMRAYWQMAGSR